jgi:predicted Zn-dependent protease
MKLCHVLTAMALLYSATTLKAEEFKHPASGLEFRLPKGWTCEAKEDKLFIANSDKTLSCVGGVIPMESAKAIFADMRAFLDKLDGFDDVEITGGPEREQVNGLEQAWYEGTANIASGETTEEIEWDMTIITGGKAVLFLIGTGNLDKNEKEYEKFFESIRRIRAEGE